MKPELVDPIAERRYDLTTAAGDRPSVWLKLDRPREFPDAEGYFCGYQVTGLSKPLAGHAGGVDGIQALYLAMEMVLMRLVATPEYRARQLTWHGSFDLGLPVRETIRALVHETSD